MNAQSARKLLHSEANPKSVETLQRFFKTGKGQYAEGDIFIGVTVPKTRALSRQCREMDLRNVLVLLKSKIHEERLLAIFILVLKYSKGTKEDKDRIFKFYVKNKRYINNWDIVDSSARQIIGAHLFDFELNKKLIYQLAKSKNLWDRRISVISTHYFIMNHSFQDILKLALVLINDKEDLIHKAVGWMLREVGERDRTPLLSFLKKHAQVMPRTMLRYSIEHLSISERKKFMAASSAVSIR